MLLTINTSIDGFEQPFTHWDGVMINKLLQEACQKFYQIWWPSVHTCELPLLQYLEIAESSAEKIWK